MWFLLQNGRWAICHIIVFSVSLNFSLLRCQQLLLHSESMISATHLHSGDKDEISGDNNIICKTQKRKLSIQKWEDLRSLIIPFFMKLILHIARLVFHFDGFFFSLSLSARVLIPYSTVHCYVLVSIKKSFCVEFLRFNMQ